MKKLGIAFVIALGIAGWHRTVQADPVEEIVVIVNKSNPAKVVTREDLRPLFQTTKSAWSDGTRAEPINQADDSTVRHGFDAAVLGLDPDRVSRYWVDRKIRGGERPPRKVSSSSAVVRAVSGDKGGVGYVLSADANASVRVVAKIRNGQVVAP